VKAEEAAQTVRKTSAAKKKRVGQEDEVGEQGAENAAASQTPRLMKRVEGRPRQDGEDAFV
jgi:hypothetical protein